MAEENLTAEENERAVILKKVKLAEKRRILALQRQSKLNVLRLQSLERTNYSRNDEDPLGRPSGGESASLGVTIQWQKGARGQDNEVEPEGRLSPNGASPVDVMILVKERFEYLNTKLPSSYNTDTIKQLEAAIKSQKERKSDRLSRGVHGLDKV